MRKPELPTSRTFFSRSPPACRCFLYCKILRNSPISLLPHFPPHVEFPTPLLPDSRSLSPSSIIAYFLQFSLFVQKRLKRSWKSITVVDKIVLSRVFFCRFLPCHTHTAVTCNLNGACATLWENTGTQAQPSIN